MSAGRHPSASAGTLDLIEDAFHCVRSAPLNSLAAYYLGSAPFVLVLLYFWADMANDAFAYRRLGVEAIALTLLFVWMKAWQTVYARRLMAFMNDSQPERLSIARCTRMAARQTIIQATGFVVLPIALLVLAPIGYAYAFYQSATVQDDGAPMGSGDFVREVWRMARLHPKQNHLVIWLLSPMMLILVAATFFLILPIMRFAAPEWTETMVRAYSAILLVILAPLSPLGMIVAVNIAATVWVLPTLLRMSLGIETAFTINPGGMLTPTFFMMICGLTYLCMDPFVKAAYVMRCFYGESIRDGRDIHVSLKKLRGLRHGGLSILLATTALLAGWTPDARAQDERPQPASEAFASATALDEALDRVLEGRRYAWRAPRERPEGESAVGLLIQSVTDRIIAGLRALRKNIEGIFDWLFDKARGRAGGDGDGSGINLDILRLTIYVLLGALFVLLIVLAWRTWRRKEPAMIIARKAADPLPDLEEENTSADELPQEGWLRMARDLSEGGDYRLAMRAFFFAGLARLSERNFIRITRYKSNRDYARELERVDHEAPGILSSYRKGVGIFEAVWYGTHRATPEGVNDFVATQHEVMGRGE